MAVPEQTPYIEHTGNGVTTSFALKFQCESKDHLIVSVDEIEPPIETWSLTGGNVVFTTAPAAGKKIILQRNTPFGRTADYQSFNNSFRPQAVNGDFDRLWLKLQELGVGDWLLKLYVDRLHQQQEEKIDDLKNYVDDRDDELRAYLMEEIRRQGVALDQLDDYYNYLMQRLAQVAIDRGWAASFIVSANGSTQQEINDFGGAEWWDKPLGYKLGATVKLTNGDIVKSTIDGNTNDPNVDMTGWIYSNDASQVKYGNQNQAQINSRTATPFDFGAIGDGVYHPLSERYDTLALAKKQYPSAQSLEDSIDLVALYSFFEHCRLNDGFTANVSIKAFVNRALIVEGVAPNYEFKTSSIFGNLTLVNKQNDYTLDRMMQINAVGLTFYGKLRFEGDDTVNVADRKQEGGLVLGDGDDDGSAGRISIHTVEGIGLKLFGTSLNNGCIFPNIENQHYYMVGSSTQGETNSNVNHYTTVTRVSDNNEISTEQYTELSVVDLPPETSQYYEFGTMVRFEGDNDPYLILSVDRTAKKIKVYPCLNFNKTYSKMGYIYGSGMAWTGNNAGVGTFGRVQSILCGIGFWGASLFGGTIGNLSTEFCGVGYTLGLRKVVALSYEFSNSYFEGNIFDYVQQYTQALPSHKLNNSQLLNFDKFAELYSYRIHFYNEAEGGYRAQNAFNKSSFYINSRTYEQKDTITTELDITLPDDVVYVNNNGSDISLVIGSGSKLWFNKKTVVIVGDGVNNSPQNNIRITAPNGYALNGGNEVILNTNKSAITATVTYNVLSRVITLSSDALYAKAGTSTQRPNNVPTGFLYIDVTLDADGKPIWWSGTNWIDATGTIV